MSLLTLLCNRPVAVEETGELSGLASAGGGGGPWRRGRRRQAAVSDETPSEVTRRVKIKPALRKRRIRAGESLAAESLEAALEELPAGLAVGGLTLRERRLLRQAAAIAARRAAEQAARTRKAQASLLLLLMLDEMTDPWREVLGTAPLGVEG